MNVVTFSAKPIGYKVPGSKADMIEFIRRTANAPTVHISMGSPITARESSCIFTLTPDSVLLPGSVDIANALMSFRLKLAYNMDTANYQISTQVIGSIPELEGVEIISELQFTVVNIDANKVRRVNSIAACEAIAARWSPVAIIADTSGEDFGDVCTSYIKSSN